MHLHSLKQVLQIIIRKYSSLFVLHMYLTSTLQFYNFRSLTVNKMLRVVKVKRITATVTYVM